MVPPPRFDKAGPDDLGDTGNGAEIPQPRWPKAPGKADALGIAKALMLGGIGGVLAYWLSIPAPFLIGPAVVVLVASLAGQRLSVSAPIRNASFVVIGLSMGTSVTPAAYEAARQWPLSFAALLLMLVITMAIGSLVLMRGWRKDSASAVLASSPGHLSYVLSLSLVLKSDTGWIGIVQSTRVLSLTILVPFAVVILGLQTGSVVVMAAPMSLVAIAISLAGAVICGFGLRLVRMPAAVLLGGLLFSTVTHLTGWIEGGVPNWLTWPGFAILGTAIGTRFSGVSVGELRRSLGAGLTFTAIAFAISGGAALLVANILELPTALVLVAFAPGGLEVMAAMAVTLGVDPTFVAAHHVFRLLVLVFLVPLALRIIQSPGGRS